MSTLRKRTAGYLFVSLVAVALAWWGCGGSGGTSEEQHSETPAGETPSGEMAAAGTERGKEIYAERCATCHGETGKGDGPAGQALNPKPRDHTDASYMGTLSDDVIKTTILEGKGAMPPHKGLFTDEELTSLVAYVRSLSQ